MTTNPQHFWVRHEVKPFEGRVICLPHHVKELIDYGHKVTVERSPTRCAKIEEYEAVGAEIVDQETWMKDAPKNAVILGLKELPEDGQPDAFPIVHDHIYFAHCYKNQDGWQNVMSRFIKGGGKLYDIEFMVDEKGARVAAFSRVAGFVGMALGIMAYIHQNGNPNVPMPAVGKYDTYDEVTNLCKSELAKYGLKPRVLVMGALGRSGGGAVDCAEKSGIAEKDIAKWDLAETKKGGPFPEIMEYDIMVNCILLRADVKIPPFITKDLLNTPNRKLRILSDVSCDPNNPNNPLPVYSAATTFDNPVTRVDTDTTTSPPFDVCAIDHMPSMISRAASEEAGSQLLPFIKQFGDEPRPDCLINTLAKFEEVVKRT